VSFHAILPSIYPTWTERCVASMDPERWTGHLTIRDNTRENLGVAASWNLGARTVLNEGQDWLVVISAAVRFGAPGGADFLDVLESSPEDAVLEAGHGIGWHLIAFRRSVLLEVGLFDEVFYPAYWEDIDYGRRYYLRYGPSGEPWWKKVSVDCAIAGFSHGVDLGGARVDSNHLMGLYEAKWGGPKGAETYDRPYGDRPLDFIGDPR
jgi:hypothetical protein